MTAWTAEAALPQAAGRKRMTLRAMLVLSAALMAINASQWPVTACLALPLLAFALADRAHQPGLWLLAAAAWTPFLVFAWDHFEDHVYLGWMWLLAVGLSLSESEEETWERLAASARLLVGVTFAVAAAWKWGTPDFLDGSTFEFLLLEDSRLHVPFLAPFSGLDLAQVEANAALMDGLRAWDGGTSPVALVRGAWTGWIVAALVAWTLLIETSVALAFLAPDGWRIASLRHPALLGFLVSVYAFLPVAGFLVALVVMGLAVGRGEQRWLRVYGLVIVALGGTALVRVLF